MLATTASQLIHPLSTSLAYSLHNFVGITMLVCIDKSFSIVPPKIVESINSHDLDGQLTSSEGE